MQSLGQYVDGGASGDAFDGIDIAVAHFQVAHSDALAAAKPSAALVGSPAAS